MSTAFCSELVDPTAFVASNAIVRGQVHLGRECSIWFGAVLRGDIVPIHIGSQTNVQDLACLHGDEGFPCQVGDRVTIGHGAIVHGALVEDEVLIGIQAVILNGARIGKHSIVGAGALVCEGQVVPPRSLVLGIPGRVIRDVTDQEVERILHGWDHYVQQSRKYMATSTGA
jgi:carbonic anhydrase/acetyltransferase-like protein (isoleucine patch superfamily)